MAKKEDIVKSGPATYRQLQEANNSQFVKPIEDPHFESFMQKLELGMQPTSLYDASAHAQKDIASPLSQQETISGSKDYWGNSIFDKKTVNENEFQSLGDIRAENQPWALKLVNGVGKAGVLAATTFAEMAGLIYGVGQGTYDVAKGKGSFLHGVWDNPVTRTLQKINDLSEELMPNYYTQDEIENPFSNIFTANFLGDKILKNLGFMVGAFYGGIPAAWGIGKLGTAAVKSARAASLAERAGMAERVGQLTARYSDDVIKKASQYGDEIAGLSDEAAAKVASKYGDDAVNLHNTLAAEGLTDAERGRKVKEGMDRVASIAQATRATTQTIGALGSAINEGAIEAINNSRDWARMERAKANDEYQATLEEINRTISNPEEAEAVTNLATEEYNRKLEEIELGRAKVGNADLLLNLPILLTSNIYQLGRLYNRGFDSARREMGSALHNFDWRHPLQKRMAGSLKEGTLKSTKTRMGAITSAFLKSNTEGMEEYLQRAASDGAGQTVSNAIDEFFNAGKREDTKVEWDDYIAGFGKAIADNAGDPSAWEEYMIGAVSSMIGMPVFGSQTKNAYASIGPVGLAGGFRGNYKEYMKAKENEEKVAEYLNKRVQDPKFKEMYQSLIRRGDLEQRLAQAVVDEDKKETKDNEFKLLFEDINAAASSGHLSEFRELIGYNQEYTDEELKDIAQSTAYTLKAEEQRARDQERKEYIEGKLAFFEKYGAATPAEKADVYHYEQELSEIEERLAGEYEDKTEGPFVMSSANGNVIYMNEHGTEEDPSSGKKQMIDILTRNRNHLLKSIDDYLRLRNDIDMETDGKLDDKKISLLTMLRAKVMDIDERSAEMAYDVVNAARGTKIRLSETLKAAENILKRAEESYNAAEAGAAKDAAKVRLDKARENYSKLHVTHQLLELLTGTKDTSILEALAKEKGIKGSWMKAFSSIMGSDLDDATQRDLNKRDLNADEVSALLTHPFNATTIMAAISSDPELSANEKTKLVDAIRDLSVLGNEKIAYREKIDEYLGNKDKIKADELKAEKTLTQEEIDNKSDDLSLRIQKAKSMSELDQIMREAFGVNADIAQAAIEKAKKTDDENVKNFIEDYENSRHFFSELEKQMSSLSSETAMGISESIMRIWENSLIDGGEGKLEDKLKSKLDEYLKVLEEEGNKGNNTAKRDAKALKQIIEKVREAQKATATNSSATNNPNPIQSEDTPKKNNEQRVQEGQDKAAALRKKVDEFIERIKKSKTFEVLNSILEEAKKFTYSTISGQKTLDKNNRIKTAFNKRKEEIEKGIQPEEEPEENNSEEEGQEKEVTYNDVIEEIKKYLKDQLNDDKFVASIKNLPTDLQKKIEKNNKDNEDKIDNDVIAILFEGVVNDAIIDEQIDEEEDESEDIFDSSSESSVGQNMHDKVIASFTSDWITFYTTFAPGQASKKALDYKYPLTLDSDKGKAVQKMLRDKGAFGFLDYNFLGYIYQAYENNDEDLPVYFLKSTDDTVNGSPDTRPVIFMAIKIGNREQNIIRQNSGRSNLSSVVKPVKIGNDEYQIIGIVNTVEGAHKDIRDAFNNFQSEVGKSLDSKIAEAKKQHEENSTPLPEFVMATKQDGSLLSSRITGINTGRLEKRSADKDDADEKRNLIEFAVESSEWEKQDPFAFKVIVGRVLDLNSRQQEPNSNWIEKNKGAIIMYVPRPDGRFYPVRCSRRMVSDWLNDNGSQLPNGEKMLREIMNGNLKNEYLENIIYYLSILLDPRKGLTDRIRAKYLLSQYFIFGKSSPIHLDKDGLLTLVFTEGEQTDEITVDLTEDDASVDDQMEDQVISFLKTLGEHRIKFSMPSEGKTELEPKEVIKSGVLEIGLKGFYNFNSNAVIEPIDSEGNKIIIENPDEGSTYSGGNGAPANALDYYDDKGNKKKYILDGEILKDSKGHEVTDPAEKALILSAFKAYQEGGDTYFMSLDLLSNTHPTLKNDLIAFLDKKYGGVYLIKSGSEYWLYDGRSGGSAKSLYKLSSQKGQELKEIIEEDIRKYINENAHKIITKRQNSGTSDESPEQDEAEIQNGGMEDEGENKKNDKKKNKKGESPESDEPAVEPSEWESPTAMIAAGHSRMGNMLREAEAMDDWIVEEICNVLKGLAAVGTNPESEDIYKKVETIIKEKETSKQEILIEELKNCKTL